VGTAFNAYLNRLPKISEGDGPSCSAISPIPPDRPFLMLATGGAWRFAGAITVHRCGFYEKVSEALRALGRNPDQRVTHDLMAAICGGTHAKAFLASGLPRRRGNTRFQLETFSCAKRSAIASTRAEAGNQRDVLHALGTAATELRKEFGEGPESIQKFDTPLERATSPLLEALKLYSEGRRLTRDKGTLEGVGALQKAVEIDRRLLWRIQAWP